MNFYAWTHDDKLSANVMTNCVQVYKWPVLFARDYFGLLDGPDSAHGRTKNTTKTPNLFNTVVLFVSDSYVRDFLPQQDDSVVIGTTKK